MMRGFITVATGAEHYYKLARQLLRSCRNCCKEVVPFALICDCENEYTAEFDHVIVIDHPHRSFLDKLSLYQYSPFEETIFIDADSLILSDPSVLWEDFSTGSPVSCYGKLFPNGSDKGWYRYDRIGHWQEYVKYQIGLHGGIYYFRKGEASQRVFETAGLLAQEYDRYDFQGLLQPADEPVIALSMAIHGCNPAEKEGQFLFLHALYGRVSLGKKDELLLDGAPCNAIVCHFGTNNTYCFMYQYLSEMVNIKYMDSSSVCVPNSWDIRKKTLKYDIKNGMDYAFKGTIKKILPIKRIKKIVFRFVRARNLSKKG